MPCSINKLVRSMYRTLKREREVAIIIHNDDRQLPVNAIIGETEHETESEEGFTATHQARDWIVEAAELVFPGDSDPLLPTRYWTVDEVATGSGTAFVWEDGNHAVWEDGTIWVSEDFDTVILAKYAMAATDSGRPYSPVDQYGELLRIHSVKVHK